jgi:hypothetical protein
MKKALIGIFLILFSSTLFSKEIEPESMYVKYIGFNVNPLLSQLIPMNNINPNINSFAVNSRSFKGRHGFKSNFGVFFDESFNNEQFVSLSFGYENRRKLTDRIYFLKGIDLNILISESFLDFSSLVGPGLSWGIEYKITKHISLSTYANLRLLMGEPNVLFQLEPPLSIGINFLISEKKHKFE